jgi:PEP-CTERM motif
MHLPAILSCRLWLFPLAVGQLICGSAEAAVIHVPAAPPIYEMWIFRDPVPLQIDINQDGTADVGLYKDLGIGMLSYGETAVFGRLKGGYLPGLNTRNLLVTAFASGQQIGAESAMSSLTNEFWAYNSETPDDLTYFQLASGVPSNPATYGGTFFGRRAYLGMRIELAPGEFHYGWVDIANTLAKPWNYEIRGWAWESEPNKAILAGAVPEPSSLILVAAGACGLLVRRRRVTVG